MRNVAQLRIDNKRMLDRQNIAIANGKIKLAKRIVSRYDKGEATKDDLTVAINSCKRVNERVHESIESLLTEAAARKRRRNTMLGDPKKAERLIRRALELV